MALDLKLLSNFQEDQKAHEPFVRHAPVHSKVKQCELTALRVVSMSNVIFPPIENRNLKCALVILVTILTVYAAIIPLIVHHSPWIQRSVAFSRKC